jgi:CheY-like chemotaxis protein
LLEYLHEEQFYHVFLATDGKKALQLIRGIRPNLFVIDQLLPGMNGLEMDDHLRVMPGFETIPVLIIGAGGSSEEVSKRHLSFLRKPRTLTEWVQESTTNADEPTIIGMASEMFCRPLQAPTTHSNVARGGLQSLHARSQ